MIKILLTLFVIFILWKLFGKAMNFIIKVLLIAFLVVLIMTFTSCTSRVSDDISDKIETETVKKKDTSKIYKAGQKSAKTIKKVEDSFKEFKKGWSSEFKK